MSTVTAVARRTRAWIETEMPRIQASTAERRPPYAGVDGNTYHVVFDKKDKEVARRTRAWIETLMRCLAPKVFPSRPPYAGVDGNTYVDTAGVLQELSPAVRGRGLKHNVIVCDNQAVAVARRTRAWIETAHHGTYLTLP